MSIIYCYENGYGTIDTMAEQFQVGRRLYDAQVMYGKLERKEELPVEQVKDLIKWYCELVNWTGQLRGHYDSMMEIINGKAEWEGKDGIRRKMTRLD